MLGAVVVQRGFDAAHPPVSEAPATLIVVDCLYGQTFPTWWRDKARRNNGLFTCMDRAGLDGIFSLTPATFEVGKGKFKETEMLHYAIVFFVIALIAALFGFGGIAAGAAGIAKILFVVFLVLAVASFFFGRGRGGKSGL